jgi:hypothetical protein
VRRDARVRRDPRDILHSSVFYVRTVNHLQTFDIVIIKIKELTLYDSCPTISSELIFIFVVPVDVP